MCSAVDKTAADAASNVLAMIDGTNVVSAAKVLAPLKPNQPSHIIKTPSAPRGML